MLINGLCPEYLSSLLHPTVRNNTAYTLRIAIDYKYIRSSTQLYYNFLPSVARIWNEFTHSTEMQRAFVLLSAVLILPKSMSLC